MAENLTFCTSFTTPNLKNGTGRNFYILCAKICNEYYTLIAEIKLPDKQNYVTQNAENRTVLFHFVPYGTKNSAHTETSISVVNGHFDMAENLTFCTSFTTANLKNGTGRKFLHPLRKICNEHYTPIAEIT